MTIDATGPDYRAYSYLDQPVWTGGLAPEEGRVPPWQGVGDAAAAKAERVLADNVTISLHDHPVRFPDPMTDAPAYNRTGRQHTAYKGLAASGLTAVFDNMMDGTACITGNAPWQWEDVVTDVGMRQADLAQQDGVRVVRNVADIEACHRDGAVGLVFGIEAATPINNELDKLDVLYGIGLRQIGITYSESNALGGGLSETTDAGLTHFGRAAVQRMNDLGVAIDVSHAGDRTGQDTCRASRAPVFMTHAGARTLWDIPRLKSDDTIKAIADTGGVFGISAAPHTTCSYTHPTHTIDSVMDHFEYVAELVGIDHVAFGPDTLYGDHVGLHSTFRHLMGSAVAGAPPHEKVPYVDGLENPTENFHNIAAWLVAHGYAEDDMAKVLGGNILRALRQTWH